MIKTKVKNPLDRRDFIMVVLGIILSIILFSIIHFIHAKEVTLNDKTHKITISWISPTITKWGQAIDANAQKYNLDPNYIAIIMTLESGGYKDANSGEAKGLMQITPSTAKDIASKYLKVPKSKYSITDPNTNIEFGVAYLAKLRDSFGDYTQGPSWNYTAELVAAGYNGGPGAANSIFKGEGLNDAQTVVYSRDAFNMWRERNASTSPTYNRWIERGGSTLINLAKDHH